MAYSAVPMTSTKDCVQYSRTPESTIVEKHAFVSVFIKNILSSSEFLEVLSLHQQLHGVDFFYLQHTSIHVLNMKSLLYMNA